MAAGDLTDKATVKSWAQFSGTVNDALLDRLVTAASQFIKTFTDRDFGVGLQSVTEIRDGSGGVEMFLANGPVASITSLAVDATPIPAQVADGQPGYFLVAPDVLVLKGYTFSRGRKNVRVAYSAGYSAVPADVAQACVEIVVSAYRRGPRVDQASKSTQGQSFSFAPGEIPKSALGTLQRYARVVPL